MISQRQPSSLPATSGRRTHCMELATVGQSGRGNRRHPRGSGASLKGLAARAGMSRSSFALKFRETVGVPAMDYLTRWRMLLASDRLENSDDPISAIAPSLGYESESAFSTAFKPVIGRSPRQNSRDLTTAPAHEDMEASRSDQFDPAAG